MSNPIFYKRHYDAIAAQIKAAIVESVASRPIEITDALDSLARSFADMFKADNTAFKRDKFLKACGL